MTEEVHTKIKHKQWRKEAKKLRRKRIRQKLAIEHKKLAEEEESSRLKDPNYIQWLQNQQEMEVVEREHEQRLHEEQEELWLRRELLARKKFREQQQKQEATAAVKEAERQRIQKEFEELKQKAKQKREERQKREQQAKQDHEQMMDKIFDFIEFGKTVPKELTSKVESNPSKPPCPFFSKTNACRFGIQCKRNHIRPKLSRILFIPNFFSHMKLFYGGTKHAGDINLECSDADLENDYKVFFEDVTEELKKFGDILNFRTCQNTQSHLRGNVLVEFSSERAALKALVHLQGRYYASRQLNVEFSAISSWKSAICGLIFANKCPMGNSCNFLHIFKNPGNLYNKPLLPPEKEKDSVRNSQREVRDSSVMSWNDDSDSRTRRDWRWSESPEPSAKINKHPLPRDRDRARSRERSHRNSEKRDKDKSSSRSSKRESRSERKRSNSKSSSRLRKHHKDDDRDDAHRKKKRRHASRSDKS